MWLLVICRRERVVDQLVVGTHGSLKAWMSKRLLPLKYMKILVFDEADEMLSRGFKEQIYDVNKFMPESVQCTIFSATMPLEVLEVRTYVILCYVIL